MCFISLSWVLAQDFTWTCLKQFHVSENTNSIILKKLFSSTNWGCEWNFLELTKTAYSLKNRILKIWSLHNLCFYLRKCFSKHLIRLIILRKCFLYLGDLTSFCFHGWKYMHLIWKNLHSRVHCTWLPIQFSTLYVCRGAVCTSVRKLSGLDCTIHTNSELACCNTLLLSDDFFLPTL